MEKQFSMSMFANKAALNKAKADYVEKNKATASAAGFNVIPSGNGTFAYAKVEGKYPVDGYETEEAAWEAAAEEATASCEVNIEQKPQSKSPGMSL